VPELLRTPPAEVARQLSQLSAQLNEVARRDFLEAAMAACAFVAMSDGVLDPAEAEVLGAVREKVKELASFDAHESAELYREYLEALRADARSGRERALAAIRRVAGDADTGALLVQVCLTVAIADHSVSQHEYAAIGELSETLGLDLRTLEA